MLSIKNGFKNFTINNKLLPVLEDITFKFNKVNLLLSLAIVVVGKVLYYA
ncbi:hypothetical protein [Providencia hangzhouensis]